MRSDAKKKISPKSFVALKTSGKRGQRSDGPHVIKGGATSSGQRARARARAHTRGERARVFSPLTGG